MNRDGKAIRTPVLAALGAALALLGCVEEKQIIYSERIALLPDKSGMLIKEVRSFGKAETEMVIRESVGDASKEIFVVPLSGSQDVKFKFRLAGDTIVLTHAQPGLEQTLRKVGPSSFPIRTESASSAAWLSSGTSEGDPIFYAEDKWGAYLDMMPK